MHFTRAIVKTTVAVLSLTVVACAAHADPFPKPGKPIRIVVPFAAGGPTDTQARIVSLELGKVTGATVVVENKPGASGIIGTQEVMRADPDGHTLLYISDGVMTQNPHTLKSATYDPFTQFVPIARVAQGGTALVVHKSVPARTPQELIAYAKANPGKISFASFGAGTVSHIYGEVLKAEYGVDIQHVPYKGSADALKDLLSGRVQIMFDSPATTIQYVKDGRIVMIGTAGEKRRTLLPETPTLLEQGLKGFELVGWNGMFGPAGMPPEVLKGVQEAMAKVTKTKAVADVLNANYFEVINETPDEFARILRRDYDRWGQYVKKAGIMPE